MIIVLYIINLILLILKKCEFKTSEVSFLRYHLKLGNITHKNISDVGTHREMETQHVIDISQGCFNFLACNLAE
jgi:hypothetical protein